VVIYRLFRILPAIVHLGEPLGSNPTPLFAIAMVVSKPLLESQVLLRSGFLAARFVSAMTISSRRKIRREAVTMILSA
jgi:hypothetical protein